MGIKTQETAACPDCEGSGNLCQGCEGDCRDGVNVICSHARESAENGGRVDCGRCDGSGEVLLEELQDE